MSQGDSVRMTQEYFDLLDEILESKNLSGRKISAKINRSPPYYSRLKMRLDLGGSWEIVEKGLDFSPRTLFAVLAQDVRYDEILAVFGPQDEPQEPKLLSRFGELEDLIATSPDCRSGKVNDETWSTLEDLERRRFKEPEKVEAECRRIVLAAMETDELLRDEAVLAVGSLGVWCTIRRHANDRGSAARGLALAIRCSSRLDQGRLSARVLQRASYLLGDVEHYRQAEMFARSAAVSYSNIGDAEGLGMAIIDMGLAAYGAGEWETAKSRLLLGAELLGSNPLHHINKAAAYHFAARSCSVRGDLVAASQFLERAAQYAGSHESHWAAIRWCAGNILFQLGQFDKAEAALREALKVYLRAEKITDIVMLLLDLAMLLVAQRRIEEIPPLAANLRPFLDRLSETKQLRNYIEDAHACLVRAQHVQALQRFKKSYEKARRTGFATPTED